MVVDRFRRLSLGQHFLTSDHIADAIVAACNILPTDTGRLFHSAAFPLTTLHRYAGFSPRGGPR